MSEETSLPSDYVAEKSIPETPREVQMNLPGIAPITPLSEREIARTYTIADILRSTNYALDIFSQQEVEKIKLFDKGGKPYLRDFVSGKERMARPEEIVRQLFLYRLINSYRYSINRMKVEVGIQFGSSISDKRADIVISEKNHPDTIYIIVEVKKPKRTEGLEQLKSYCNATGAPIGVWTNGGEIEVWHRMMVPGNWTGR